MQSRKVCVVHDALSIELPQTVCYDAQVVVCKAWNAFVVVLVELSDMFASNLTVHDKVRFILPHHAIAFSLYDIVALINRKIEWCT